MLTTIEKESYKGYLAVLAVIYILAIVAYLFLTMLLIKKDVYIQSLILKESGSRMVHNQFCSAWNRRCKSAQHES